MQPKYLFVVLIHNKNKYEVGTVSPRVICVFLLTFEGGVSFVNLFC